MEDMFSKMQELLADPESMKQLSELAQMLQSETDAAPAPPPTEQTESAESGGMPFDPMMLMKMGELLGNARKSDENTALLLALRPHLRVERREKVDKAVRLLQLMNIFTSLKESGMLQNLL